MRKSCGRPFSQTKAMPCRSDRSRLDTANRTGRNPRGGPCKVYTAKINFLKTKAVASGLPCARPRALFRRELCQEGGVGGSGGSGGSAWREKGRRPFFTDRSDVGLAGFPATGSPPGRLVAIAAYTALSSRPIGGFLPDTGPIGLEGSRGECSVAKSV